MPLNRTINANIGKAHNTRCRVMVSGGISRKAISPKKNEPPQTAASINSIIVECKSKVSVADLVMSSGSKYSNCSLLVPQLDNVSRPVSCGYSQTKSISRSRDKALKADFDTPQRIGAFFPQQPLVLGESNIYVLSWWRQKKLHPNKFTRLIIKGHGQKRDGPQMEVSFSITAFEP